MFNNTPSITDEERLRLLMQKLGRNQTDIVRLWGRVGQFPDGVGNNVTGQASPFIAYTPAQAPTTTAAPTTTTTTTPAPITQYLYPVWDVLRSGNINYSSGSTVWSLIDDRESWPDHTNYIRLPESENGDFDVFMDALVPFISLLSLDVEIYCKNAINTDLLSFTAQVIGADEVTPLTDEVAITGVGSAESAFTLRTASFTLEPEAQDYTHWSRPTLRVRFETDNDGGSPSFYLSAARVKPIYIPFF